MDELEVIKSLETNAFFSNELACSSLIYFNWMAMIEKHLLSELHEINNRLSVIQIETEILNNQSVQKSIEEIAQIVKSLQKLIYMPKL